MLGKLLKHELRATAHTMLPLFGLLLLVSALTNLLMRAFNGKEVPAVVGIALTLLAILFTVGMVAVGFVTVAAMIQRFRNNLFRDEGYIMHTLPVSVHAHIWAKVIVAGLWYTLAAVTFVLSGFIMAADAEFVQDMIGVLGELLKALGDLENVEILAEILGLLILLSICFSLLDYASLAVGHSRPTRKMLWSILAFLGLVFLASLVVKGLNSLAWPQGVDGLVDLFYDGSGAMTLWRVMCLFEAGYLILFSAALYGVTVWFIKHKLNLE